MNFIFFTLLLFLTLVAADEYQLTFINSARSPVVALCIYQSWPNTAPGLVSVAWKKGSAAYQQVAKITWNYKFNAILSNYHDDGNVGVFSNMQSLSANITDIFEVIDNEVSYCCYY